MRTAFLGLGSNIGDRLGLLAEAVRRLNDTPGLAVARVSSVYETEPIGPVDQPPFLNLAVEIASELTPHELLDCCLGIEHELGRVRRERWGPRTIDIDLLDFDGVEMRDERLALPHPAMAERSFVMVPLAEIAPDLRVGEATAAEHASRLGSGGVSPAGELKW